MRRSSSRQGASARTTCPSCSPVTRRSPGPRSSIRQLEISTASKRHYDLIIVGAGPAGLAARSTASDGLSTLVLEETSRAVQAGYTP